MDWHTLDGPAALVYWDSSSKNGLSTSKVEERRARLGENSLPVPPRESAIKQLLGQFADPLVGALLVAAIVSLGVAISEDRGGHWLARFSDTIAILLIVVVNALLGFFQERRAEAALDALQKMAAPNAKVLRDGTVAILPARELVPGDIVEMAAGDAIPADLRLLTASDFFAEESPLTGESTSVQKAAEPKLGEETPLAERRNMVYMGTIAVRGHARGLVVQTGQYTELGRIGTLIRGAEREDTPLEQRLARLGKIILLVCLGLSAALFAIGMVQEQRSWTVLLLTAVSLAVAAIPEGLPAITTITLALGMQRMATEGAIVRKLPAVETLGSATVICSDKTGTLTQNAMTVRSIETADGAYDVTGDGYAIEGDILGQDGAPLADTPTSVQTLLEVAAICNNAKFDDAEEGRKVVGDPTEAALLVLSAKAGFARERLLEEITIQRTLPFDSDRKRMTVVAARADGTRRAYVKGSPDHLLPTCTHVLTADGPIPLDAAERDRLGERNEAYAKRALRVLAFAVKEDPDPDAPEDELVFVGFAAMLDPPRPEVRAAVEECRHAGIAVKMITGDHKLTAIAIARELGLWDESSIAMTGAEIEETDEQRLLSKIERVTVFARTTAEQKLRLVRTLKKLGHVVAMTGDGVNDAPALREAQIGVAMGLGGTDVAREAAEMVLADDNFATIVVAVREGRAIFRNIQKFIFFLNSANAGLVVAVIVGSFFEWMPQLTPLQLLWVNLVTNGLPALALGVDPPEPGQMDERPRNPTEGIVGWHDLFGMLIVGTVMGGAALFIFWLPDLAPELLGSRDRAEALLRCRAMAFSLLAISPLVHAFNCRSRTRSAFERPFSNRALWGAIAISFSVHAITVLVPALHPIFHTHLLTLTEWGVVLGLSFLPVPVYEAIKLVWRAVAKRKRREPAAVGD